jgi:hypothetical protein
MHRVWAAAVTPPLPTEIDTLPLLNFKMRQMPQAIACGIASAGSTKI